MPIVIRLSFLVGLFSQYFDNNLFSMLSLPLLHTCQLKI